MSATHVCPRSHAVVCERHQSGVWGRKGCVARFVAAQPPVNAALHSHAHISYPSLGALWLPWLLLAF